MSQQVLVIHNRWALGDTVCLSALPRDVHRAYPGRFKIYTAGHYRNVFWRNNPHCEKAPDGVKGRLLNLGYQDGIHASNGGLKIHFLAWFHRAFKEATGLPVPVTEPKGCIVLSAEEQAVRPEGRYWLVVAGGKMDMTAKVWSVQHWQSTVDALRRQGVRVVQAGGSFNKHFHPTLDRVEQWVGKTQNERTFFSLVAGAEGVVCGVTSAMHIAAVFDKPCVVIAGGREPPWWEAYTNCYSSFGERCKPVKVEHTFLHTVGLLDCCKDRGCWKDRTVPVEQTDLTDPKKKRQLCRRPVSVGHQAVPECLKMITPDHVVEAVMNYYEKGVLPPIGTPSRRYSLPQPAVDVVKVAKDIRAVETLLPKLLGQLGVAAEPSVPQEDGTHLVTVEPPPLVQEYVKRPLVVDPGEPGGGKTVVSKVTFDNGSVVSIDEAPADPVRGLSLPPAPPQLLHAWDSWKTQLPKEVKPREGENPEFAALDHPYVGGKFTLFVLGYGDHLDILERCLGSVVNTCPRHRYELRVALNQPTQRVQDYVVGLYNAGVVRHVYLDHKERKKYPAMREMFHDAVRPIETPYVCWFDDDSWCRKDNWMVLLARTIVKNHPHQGRLYGAWYVHDLLSVKRPGALREKWFQAAEWWKGRQLYTGSGRRMSPNGSQIVFASGGFWALATHVIREAGIPDARLNHNGGDITIGCQVTQAGYKVVDFSPRPAKDIIAWSDSPRRGYQENFPWA